MGPSGSGEDRSTIIARGANSPRYMRWALLATLGLAAVLLAWLHFGRHPRPPEKLSVPRDALVALGEGRFGSWNSDGSRLCFLTPSPRPTAGSAALVTVAPDGSDRQTLRLPEGDVFAAVWSATRNTILCNRRPPPPPSHVRQESDQQATQIYAVDLATGEGRVVHEAANTARPITDGLGDGRIYFRGWSPGGATVPPHSFLAAVPWSGAQAEVVARNVGFPAAGPGPADLTVFTGWAPAGIASGLYAYNASTGSLRRLGEWDLCMYGVTPAFSSDGRTLYLIHSTGCPSHSRVVRCTLGQSRAEALWDRKGTTPLSLALSPDGRWLAVGMEFALGPSTRAEVADPPPPPRSAIVMLRLPEGDAYELDLGVDGQPGVALHAWDPAGRHLAVRVGSALYCLRVADLLAAT